MSMTELPYIVIAGPTATGKTRVAAELARLVGGEVISADSMQIYKFMDIGTAKPRLEETLGIPHHLVDELYPDEPYSAYAFKQMAEERAALIRAKGKYPIICGGTGFYINALLNDTGFEDTYKDEAYREELYGIGEAQGPEALHALLKGLDPEGAEAIHPNNMRRVVRALEFYKQTGGPISAHNLTERAKSPQNGVINVLTRDRPGLYEGINRRVDRMIDAGLEDEVRRLLAMGYAPGLTSMQGLGYKEMARYVDGQYSLDEAVVAIKTGTRRYAKRQLTWFSRQCQGTWFDVTAYASPRDIAEKVAAGLP